MTDRVTSEQEIREALLEKGLPADERDVDFVKLYQIEQMEKAHELYEAAVADNINFAVAGDDDEVFVNIKWLGSLVRTVMEASVEGESPSALYIAEALSQTIMAAEKFVGKS